MSKSYIPQDWKVSILKKQRNYCAGKDCAKLHNGRKLQVTLSSHFDHIRPEAMDGKNIKSNIQALCPNCHSEKTRKDRVRIKKWKEIYGKKDSIGVKPVKFKPYKIKPYKIKPYKPPKMKW